LYHGDEFHYLFLGQNEVIQIGEKKVYPTVFCSKFIINKTECCRYATKKYWITINFSDKYYMRKRLDDDFQNVQDI
jgi:hypothetical protein